MEQLLFIQLIRLASYPLKLRRQGLFIHNCWPSPLLMFSVTSKENKSKYLGDWLLDRCGKSEILSMRAAFLCSYFVLCCLLPHLRSHQALSLDLLPYRDYPLYALNPCRPLPPPRSSVWELHVLGVEVSQMAYWSVFLIAFLEHVITKFTHRLLINTHTHLLKEKMS